MKRIKSFLNVFFIFALIISITSTSVVSAQTLSNQLSEAPPSKDFSDPVIPFGADAPGKNASTHDVSISDYNYQAKSMGYRLYTDKWLKGSSSLSIDINNWEVIEYHGGTTNNLTLRVYNSSNKQVASKTITINKNAYTTFSNLSPSEKYYVCFEVPLNGNRYAYNGSIGK